MSSFTRSRNEMVQCPECRGSGSLTWNFGHTSCTCPICKGYGHITLEAKLRRQYSNEGHSKRVVEAMIDDFFDK